MCLDQSQTILIGIFVLYSISKLSFSLHCLGFSVGATLSMRENRLHFEFKKIMKRMYEQM
jgi:hypothetical protein